MTYTPKSINRVDVPGASIYIIVDEDAGMLQPVVVYDRTAQLKAMRELYEELQGRVAVLEASICLCGVHSDGAREHSTACGVHNQ